MALKKVKGKSRKIFWHGLTTPTFLGLKELELETEAQSSRVEEARRRDENEMESTVFENHRKSLIQHCERSELRLYFEWPKGY